MNGSVGAVGDALSFQAEALKLRSYRQELLAANIANADTPNYKAVDFDFAQALRNATSSTTAQANPAALATTDPAHQSGRGVAAGQPTLLYHQPSQSSLDGNSVEMDVERAKFADNTVRYEAALTLLNSKIKSLLSVIQG
jgi:flagellar basal-body rod protein FlgB